MRFIFRMARNCGLPHPDFLLEMMTARQLAEMEVFESLDPSGEFRDDVRVAQTNMLLEALLCKDTKRKPRTKLKDWLISQLDRSEHKSEEELKRKAEVAFSALKGFMK